ncbi:hypothetical protein EES39_25555 [Streptomyces sp. ADI92-24]|nr:hypothetical protein EDD95_3827 [Streptomyces sp. CEV 2-1]RPK40105.1 hypothetical protein EES39_25555 [Streptomyces sp. ADI92-24]
MTRAARGENPRDAAVSAGAAQPGQARQVRINLP